MKTINIILFVSALLASAKPTLQVATKYALVEMTPPKLSDIPAIRAGKLKQHHNFPINLDEF